jgi:nitrite reductase/ring-hydroxylating ferredoxin subunit
MELTESRRRFLELMCAATITTVCCPHNLLGRIFPKIKENGDKLLGIYGLNIDKYPELANIWGSVRFLIEDTIGYFPKVILTRVPPETYEVEFIALLEQCPHEGYPVKPLDPDLHVFECSGHGTLFDVTGKYIWGPASEDLTRFNLTYDGDKTVYIEIPALIASAATETENLTYLRQNYPNPCSNITTIEYGVEKPSTVELRLLNLKGETISTISKFVGNATEQLEQIDVTNLPNGVYLYSLFVDGKYCHTRKLIVQR